MTYNADNQQLRRYKNHAEGKKTADFEDKNRRLPFSPLQYLVRQYVSSAAVGIDLITTEGLRLSCATSFNCFFALSVGIDLITTEGLRQGKKTNDASFDIGWN